MDKKIKRPLNPFMIYLMDVRKELKNTCYKLTQNDICLIASTLWKEEKIDIKKTYIEKSKTLKDIHYKKYPNYKYRPIRRKLKCNF